LSVKPVIFTGFVSLLVKANLTTAKSAKVTNSYLYLVGSGQAAGVPVFVLVALGRGVALGESKISVQGGRPPPKSTTNVVPSKSLTVMKLLKLLDAAFRKNS